MQNDWKIHTCVVLNHCMHHALCQYVVLFYFWNMCFIMKSRIFNTEEKRYNMRNIKWFIDVLIFFFKMLPDALYMYLISLYISVALFYNMWMIVHFVCCFLKEFSIMCDLLTFNVQRMIKKKLFRQCWKCTLIFTRMHKKSAQINYIHDLYRVCWDLIFSVDLLKKINI